MTQVQKIQALLARIDRTSVGVEHALSFEMPAPCGAIVRVRFDGMLDTGLVAVVWSGEPGAGTPELDPLPGSAAGYVDFNVPNSVITASIGTGVTLLAALVRGEEHWVSSPRELAVGSLGTTMGQSGRSSPVLSTPKGPCTRLELPSMPV